MHSEATKKGIEVQSAHLDIDAIARSGQCFRLREEAAGDFLLVAMGQALRITQLGEGRCLFHCDAGAYQSLWSPYFDLDTDYADFGRDIPPEDGFLQRALAYGRGLRILRQDAWEMLITFIISQRKNIPAIKSAVEQLSRSFGAPIPGTSGDCFAFPTPRALADCSGQDLAACSLGYRCRYVGAAARMVAEEELDLEALARLPDDALREALLRVPGVGDKVANCVMLFGFHRIAAFPRDVWINRIIDSEYGGDFPVARYPGYAGVIQQYMFHYARARAAGEAL